MNLLDRKGLTQDERFKYASLLAFISSIILGIVTGLLRNLYATSLWIIPIGLGIAYVVRRYGRGVQTRFSIMAVVFVLFSILVSDVIFNFGIAGLLSFESFRLAFTFGLIEDISKVAWIVSRLLSVFIAFSYSRVV